MCSQLVIPFSVTTQMQGHFEKLLSNLKVPEEFNWPDVFGKALRLWAERSLQKQIRVLSLFTGAGGLDIGFHDAGIEVVSMVEIDPKFVASLQANVGDRRYFKKSEIMCADIVNFKPRPEINVDLVIGGVPCQPFSAAGRRAAGAPGMNDSRGGLFKQFIRILNVVQPRAFVFENVYGLTGVQNGQAWRSILSAFNELGYNVTYRILDAADYGVPQHRERVIVVGSRNTEYAFPRPTHGPDSPYNHPYYTAEDAIATVQEEEKPKQPGGRWGHLLCDIPPGLNYSFYTSKMGHPQPLFSWRSKFSDFLYKADPHTPVRAIKATGGQYTGPFHWDNRPFSLAELKRLQTIPDDYVLMGSRQSVIQQIGNSVPPQLARILALSLLQQLWSVGLPAELSLLAPHEKLNFRSRKATLTRLYRQKAWNALAYLGDSIAKGHSGGPDKTYEASLKLSNFDWQVAERSNLRVKVHYLASTLTIEIEQSDQFAVASKPNGTFEISIEPSKLGWDIPYHKVKLIGSPLTPETFVGVWKAFEYHLATRNLKTDLVQLSGYYQYPSHFNVTMETQATIDDFFWQIVKRVVRGDGVRQQLHLGTLAQIWELSTGVAGQALKRLRLLAYEVRGHSTNPNILEEHFLIPYCYPTLNPRSVQLRKLLEV